SVGKNFQLHYVDYRFHCNTRDQSNPKILTLRSVGVGTHRAVAKTQLYRLSQMEKATMKRTSLVLLTVFAMVMLTAAFGQTTPSATPSQQTPSAQDQSQGTNPGQPSSASDSKNSFVGNIAKSGGKYVLHTASADYQLDDQAQAKKFNGKDV